MKVTGRNWLMSFVLAFAVLFLAVCADYAGAQVVRPITPPPPPPPPPIMHPLPVLPVIPGPNPKITPLPKVEPAPKLTPVLPRPVTPAPVPQSAHGTSVSG